jgi:hypothetical protein
MSEKTEGAIKYIRRHGQHWAENKDNTILTQYRKPKMMSNTDPTTKNQEDERHRPHHKKPGLNPNACVG